MTLLHMETDLVRDTGQQVQKVTDSLNQQAQQLEQSVQTLAGSWQGSSSDTFVGEANLLLRQLSELVNNGSNLYQRLQREVDEWESVDNGAAKFHAAAGILLGIGPIGRLQMASLSFTGDGQVLGTATDIAGYRSLSWTKRFDELAELELRIQELEQETGTGLSLEDTKQRINEINHEIDGLEKQFAEAEKSANRWFNRVVPEFPFSEDDDGMPWRVRTDDYEDQMVGLGEKITKLQAARSDLHLHEMKIEGLNQLRQQKEGFQTIIVEGIPEDGPSPIHPYFPGEENTNCTKYASAKRNLPETVRGNAYEWDDQATKGGYDVGRYPLKGSIMVMEPGIKGAHATAGHVAFVERVEPQSNGTYKVIYTDNSHTDPNHPAEITITPSDEGISFIYDKL